MGKVIFLRKSASYLRLAVCAELVSGGLLATDLSDAADVDVSVPDGLVTLSSVATTIFQEDFSDAPHFGRPVSYGNSLKVDVSALTPDGCRCLEVSGISTGNLDTAWYVDLARRETLPRFAERFAVSAEICGTHPTSRIQLLPPHASHVEWFDRRGNLLDTTTFRFVIPSTGFQLQRHVDRIPAGACSFRVRLGFDMPDLKKGECVRFRNFRIGLLEGAYERRGEIVSYPREAGPVSWSADVPPGTCVKFQCASADTTDELRAAAFLGPDGTPATFFSRPFRPKGRYLRYRAVLEGDGAKTPVLRSVTIGGRTDSAFKNRRDILPPYASIVNATAPVADPAFRPRIKVVDDSTVDWTKLGIALDGRDETKSFRRVAGDELEYTGPACRWTPGLHRVVVDVRDWCGNGHRAEKRFYVGERPKDTPNATLRDDGVVLLDGRPFFPIGIYGLNRCEFNGHDYEKAMRQLKSVGFNVVQSYARDHDEVLRAAVKTGMKTFSKARMPEEGFFSLARECPAVLAYYLGDDTSAYDSPMGLRDKMDAMVAADGTRLTCQADACGTSRAVSKYFDYAPGTHALLPEIYPILGTDKDRFAVAAVVRELRRIKSDAAVQGLVRARWPLLQYFKGWTYFKRFPEEEELVAITFAALAQDVHGIFWYTYESSVDAHGRNYGCVSTPEAWRAISTLSSRVASLAPVLLERTPADQPVVNTLEGPLADHFGSPSLSVLLKRHQGHVYLIVANSAVDPVRAELRFDAPSERGAVLWSDAVAERHGGVLTETFPPASARVFRF